MIGSKIEVVKYAPTDPRLGRHVEHDNRSKQFAFLGKRVKPEKKTTHWTSAAAPLDQGELGSCTGNALAQWLNTDFAQGYGRLNHHLNENDAIELYEKATTLDAIPGRYLPDDTGSTGNAAAKAGCLAGYLDSYSWLFSFTSIQAAIEKQPLMVGTLWTDKMFDPINGLVKVGALVNSNIAGGHEYLMTGIDWEEEVFEFRNSWGEWEGAKQGGYFAISFRDFVKLIDADGDVTVPKINPVEEKK